MLPQIIRLILVMQHSLYMAAPLYQTHSPRSLLCTGLPCVCSLHMMMCKAAMLCTRLIWYEHYIKYRVLAYLCIIDAVPV